MDTYLAQEEFVPGKHGIGHVHGIFYTLFGTTTFTAGKTPLESRRLTENLFDREIFEEYRPREMVLGDILHALDTDVFERDGAWNVCYVGGVAVSIGWMPEDGCWRVNAWELDGGPWQPPARIFSTHFADA